MSENNDNSDKTISPVVSIKIVAADGAISDDPAVILSEEALQTSVAENPNVADPALRFALGAQLTFPGFWFKKDFEALNANPDYGFEVVAVQFSVRRKVQQ